MLEDLERKYALTSDLLQININDITNLQYQIDYINQYQFKYNMKIEAVSIFDYSRSEASDAEAVKLLLEKYNAYYGNSQKIYTQTYFEITERVKFNYYENLIISHADQSLGLYDNRHSTYFRENSRIIVNFYDSYKEILIKE